MLSLAPLKCKQNKRSNIHHCTFLIIAAIQSFAMAAPPRRTSARLRCRTPVSISRLISSIVLNKYQAKTPEPINSLGGLIERDESPYNQQSLNAAVATHAIGHIPGAFESDSFLTTPSARPVPDQENMHPSKIQQSTAKAPDQGLILGFSDIKNRDRPAGIQDTPSKSKIAIPGFEFKFANADIALTAETQRIMDSVREEAAKIKEQMRLHRDEQARKDEEAEVDITGRRIAHPKSKSGRYSDTHKSQFSKMDSIANHPSVLKRKIVSTTEIGAPKSLKRSQSKAELLDERIENPAPSKRVKASGGDDVSTSRPISRDGSNIPRLATLPSVVTTPTKASLARSASAKSIRTTKISSLMRSKSTKELVKPKQNIGNTPTRSLFGLKKSISMKSILTKPQPKYSDDPVMIAAGTHLPLREQFSGTPVKAIKRVGFAEDLTSPTPTRTTGLRMPTKILTPYRRTTASSNELVSSPLKYIETVHSESINLKVVQHCPSVPAVSTPSEIKSDPIAISTPTPRRIMLPASCSKIPKDKEGVSYPFLQPLASNPSRPGDFSFRADKQIKFGPSQTIRPVRPSGIPTTIAPALLSMPHGMANKKRARLMEEDDEEDRENQSPVPDGSPSKKLRVSIGQDIKPTTPRRRLGTFKPESATSIRKKTLSLSRLNFLSRPKNRG